MDNLWSFLNQTLALSVTAALLLLLKKLFEDKLSPRWQYGIWSIFTLRLLLPVGLFHRYLFPQGQVLLAWAKNAVEGRLSSALSAPYEEITVSAPVPLLPDGFFVPRSITDWLFSLYTAGVVISLLWLAGTYVLLRRTVSKGHKAGDAEMAQVQAVAAAHALPMPHRIMVLPQVESAFVCGFLRPVLVLPERPVDDKVLLHELLHLRYGDIWAGAGICLMRCLHWCNPLVRYCCTRMQNDCEALCDQRVLERLEGEDRRQYGVILLSMADEKYARASGTSSMANGAGNIKRRITAITRFKRYPAGMALVSVCVAVVLGATCLAGSAQADTITLSEHILSLAIAQASVYRPTTPAGALDLYTSAVLTDNGAILAMVTPEKEQAVLAEKLAASPQWSLGLSQFWEEAEAPNYFERWEEGMDAPVRTYQANWYVYNLLKTEDNYTGILVLDASPWASASYEEAPWIFYQDILLEPNGDGWSVRPLSDWTRLPFDTRYAALSAKYGSEDIPALVYHGTNATHEFWIELQYILSVPGQEEKNWSEYRDFSMNIFSGNAAVLDYALRPNIRFSTQHCQDGGHAIDLTTGDPLFHHVQYWCLTAQEAAKMPTHAPNREADGTISLPSSYCFSGSNYGGTSDSQSAPAALLLQYTIDDQEYTCIVRPEGGTA